ncbi:biotin/lipoate--protein ligase family protein [Oceanibacterium hippocampi]|uniref:Bifunctional ligase/repressor BirA n=1 Tax=Oceanibacterium hippocampi TaxID=745714 RepID=A0A1Y5TFA1_9PROT|nr:biotin/lipoate--protein ligase family protein [Oceanibacterium hippocampi]SLN60560.1 Bifunctional ligase/repressor BirA [Oceanibacterium hippocampi]
MEKLQDPSGGCAPLCYPPAMQAALDLPPLFHPVILTDPSATLDAAATAAADGADPGTLFWAPDPSRAIFAVVLGPENEMRVSRGVVHVAALALGSALGALIPPEVAVTYRWPDRIIVNGLPAARLALLGPEAAESAVPDWLVLGVSVAIGGELPPPDAQGRLRSTTLEAESCIGLRPDMLIASFARYLMSWMRRWEEDGFEMIATEWLGRADGRDKAVPIHAGGKTLRGQVVGLEAPGDLVLRKDGKPVGLKLRKGLSMQAPRGWPDA